MTGRAIAGFPRPLGVEAAERQRANGLSLQSQSQSDGNGNGAGGAASEGGCSAANTVAAVPSPRVVVTCGLCHSAAVTSSPDAWKVAHQGAKHFGRPFTFSQRSAR